MRFKKGDIVKLSKSIEQHEKECRIPPHIEQHEKECRIPMLYGMCSLRYRRIFNHHFNNLHGKGIVIPPYLAKGVGKVINVDRLDRTAPKTDRRQIYQVYFLFGIDLGKKYISYHKDWFMENELEKADEKEREFFLNLMEIIDAKEVAESI
jgi:hypothetical protein